jgi:hypothetical protein
MGLVALPLLPKNRASGSARTGRSLPRGEAAVRPCSIPAWLSAAFTREHNEPCDPRQVKATATRAVSGTAEDRPIGRPLVALPCTDSGHVAGGDRVAAFGGERQSDRDCRNGDKGVARMAVRAAPVSRGSTSRRGAFRRSAVTSAAAVVAASAGPGCHAPGGTIRRGRGLLRSRLGALCGPV